MKRHIFIFAMLLFIFSCSNDEFEETSQTANQELTDLRVQYKRGNNVSTTAINYIKERTNNTFTVSTKKGRIKLNNSSSFSKSNDLGTIDTSKEIVVVNETNTKHTFKVITPQESLNTITNLIIVEKGNNSYEYFLKYTFFGELPINEETGIIDFSKFNGTIETFNASGDLIGSMTIENSVITSDEGQLSPCPDDNQDPNDDDINSGSNSSGSDSGTGIPNDDTGEDPVNSGNGDPDSSAQFTDPNGDCGLTFSYEQCGCGGDANGHAPQAGYDCCQGSPLVIRDCNGSIIAQRNSNTSTTMFKRNAFDPCDDGDIGVILDDDVLCGMNDESFNAYYSNKSPFDVDLSLVRENCDNINLPDPANEKFMCVYNKLVKSPKFKHLFNNVFGESKNINVSFQIVDSIPNKPSGTKGVCRTLGGHTDNEGNLLDLELAIILKRSHIENGSRISVAKTILHECIHAYLKLKKIDCIQGTNFGDMENTELGRLINEYNDGACAPGQGDHQFMFNFMIPAMQEMLADVRDNLIPENHRSLAEGLNHGSSHNPVVPSTPWNWNQFYHYFSLSGLHETTAFESEIASDSIKNHLFFKYVDAGESFSKTHCED